MCCEAWEHGPPSNAAAIEKGSSYEQRKTSKDASVEGVVSGASLVLRGGFVVDPVTATAEQRDLYICDGVIVGEADGKACAPTEVDVAGKWLIPGLVDMHVHARGMSRGDWTEASMKVEEVAAMFRIAGVTGFLDSMNDEAAIFPVRDGQRTSGTFPGADVFASGGAFTPTGGHGTEYGLPATSYHLVDSADDVTRELDAIERKKPDLIKIMYDHLGDDGEVIADGEEGADGVAMSKAVMVALVKACNARGVRTQVHTTVWQDARDAIEAGATAIAHLGEPDIPHDVVLLAKQHDVFWIPTLSLYHGLLDVMNDQSLLDDPLLQKVAPKDVIESYRLGNISRDPETMAWLGRHTRDFANVGKLHHAGVKLLAGSDTIEQGTFIGWSLHRELRLLVQAGLSAFDALAAATTRAGELLGHSLGVEEGDEGTVVVLDASPIDDVWNTTKIALVVHHGAVVTF
jgi:imidazolonepropionase-like amidohydrolase